jgi:NitT/TauT family transport system substrate-binding protein
LHKHRPEVDANVAKGETEAVAELAEIKGKPLAEIDPSRIQATLDVVKGAFTLKSDVSANDIFEPGYVPK